MDFVIAPRGQPPIAIEAKWKADAFEAGGMRAFRKLHPGGRNFVVASDVASVYKREIGSVAVTFCPLARLAEELSAI